MRKSISPFLRTGLLAALTALPGALAHAQVVLAPGTPQIGSSNPVSPEPAVPRPGTTPCVVPLFQNIAFDDFTPRTFTYTPPAACPGPWAKVVFTGDFTVSAGRQFDRTASFYLGHASIYYGTTAEPRAALSPSWHVERDVTDLAAIFASTQTGEANIGNFVGTDGGVDYTGIIYANAALEFYPASFRDPAPRTPDIVVPVNGTGGDAGTLNTTTDQITQTLNLPTNVESVYLDVIAQNQSNDEFFYFCVPDDQAANLQSCGGTAFRETEIWIDGQPAGVAPVFPWIFTGGVDTGLWEPIPGVQTLDLRPYRVNLTPFAGVLSDGNPHTVAVSVFNANTYFLATANLLVYTDPLSRKITGGILANTLSEAPTPVVDEKITQDPTTQDFVGTVTVSSNRSFTIRGFVNTSHGRVETTVQQTVNFVNAQQFDVGANTDLQNVNQSSTVDATTTTRQGLLVTESEQHLSYPFTFDFNFASASGSPSETVKVNQQFLLTTTEGLPGLPLLLTSTRDQLEGQDTEAENSSGQVTTAPATTHSYRYNDLLGHCYSETLSAQNLALTSVTDGEGCRGGNHLQ